MVIILFIVLSKVFIKHLTVFIKDSNLSDSADDNIDILKNKENECVSR